ncbi:uncharacterized protein LOC143178412 [Calliopsis andreniformis]|uniref:uncharacterized protein LOC143178412 n=1 Tax=Calliopsis andreniformis TaxID=337506 RepID=UPI003FCC84CB
MNYDRYYDKKADGAYVLHFPNSKGLSKDELTNIFSAFGKVLSVDDRGQAFGLCFIKYQHLDDCKRCLDGLQNHEFIKILPHKNKMQPNVAQKKKIQKEYEGMNDRNSPILHSDNQFYKKNMNDMKNKRYSYNKRDNQSDSSESKSFFAKDANNFNNDIMENENGSDISSISSKNMNHFLKLKMLQRVASSTSVSSGTVEEHITKIKEKTDQNDFSSLACMSEKFVRNRKPSPLISKIVPAHEVIVANIHSSLGIHYILHLFEKHNPICASFIMTIPKTKIRYCHVYFETSAATIAIENEFDMYLLCNSNLIVLRPQRLMEEAL